MIHSRGILCDCEILAKDRCEQVHIHSLADILAWQSLIPWCPIKLRAKSNSSAVSASVIQHIHYIYIEASLKYNV